MRMTRNTRRLRMRLVTKSCILRRGEIEALEDNLSTLEFAVASFPFADLTVTVTYRPRCDEYHVKTRLLLPGKANFTGEHDALVLPAYERCLRKLVRKVESYKQQLRRRIEGVHASPTTSADAGAAPAPAANARQTEQRLRQACDAQDFHAFREELSEFDEMIRRRVGRWVRRYSDFDVAFDGADADAAATLPIDDLVEEIALTAFERCPSKPAAMRAGDWLESLIDPAMRSFLSHPDEELEAISFARTLQEMHDELQRKDDEEFDMPTGRFDSTSGDFGDSSGPGDLFRRPR